MVLAFYNKLATYDAPLPPFVPAGYVLCIESSRVARRAIEAHGAGLVPCGENREECASRVEHEVVVAGSVLSEMGAKLS